MIDRQEMHRRIDSLADARNAAETRARMERTEELWQVLCAADRKLFAYCMQAQDAIDAERKDQP